MSVKKLVKPGGIKIFFEDNSQGSGGGALRDLGNLVNPSLNPAIETLEHFSSRGGERLKDKEVITQRQIEISFSLDWIDVRNMRLALLAGTITSNTAGAVEITNELIRLTGTTPSALAMAPADPHGAEVTNEAGTTTYDESTDYEITAANVGTAGTGSFEIAGDYAAQFAPGRVFVVTGSTGNDGTYTVSSGGASNYMGTTTILVDEAVPDGTADGDITAGDYTISIAGQTIVRSANSTIVSGADVQVSYNWDAPANDSFAPMSAAYFEGRVRIIMQPKEGIGIVWDIPKAQIRPENEFNLDDQNFLELPMVLTVLDNSDSTPTTPFGTYRQFDIAA